jgi:hypothetical protein
VSGNLRLPIDAACENGAARVLVPLPVRQKRRRFSRLGPPRVTQLLLQAEDFRRLLDCAEAVNQAELARRFRLTRARVTQLLQLLDLAPEIRNFIKTLGPETPERMVTERKLRNLARFDHHGQIRWADEHIEGFTVGPKIIPLVMGRVKAHRA